jgi:DNA-binding CsgD family transcriptional regulator
LGRTLTSEVVVGRAQPLAALDGALADTPSVTLLSGEAGVGKTRLALETEARARARGFAVLHGESVEFGGDAIAYAPVVAALRDVGGPVLAGGSAGELYERLLALLGRLAGERGPLLMVLEDVHWAGRSTAELLAFLARNLRTERIAVLATYRSDDELPEHLRRSAVTRIALAPFTVPEVAAQLEAIAGGPLPAGLVADLHRRAGGNPFYVEELYAAREDGGIPATLTDAVLQRVDRLGAQAAQTLAVVAAAGGSLDDGLLERLAPDPDALRAALAAGLLVREPAGVALRHGLIGEVLYGRLLPAERRALHRAIAEALPADAAARRADQCHRAGLRADALAASVRAGLDAAAMHAHAEAQVHFERALALWDEAVPLPVDRGELLAAAAQAARFAGDADRAVTLCREALETFDHAAEPERAARLFERLGEYTYWDDEAALACYAAGLRLLPGDPWLLAGEGHALMGLRRWAQARERCEAALATGAQVLRAHITLGLVLAFLGEPEAGEAHLQRALELSDSAEDTARAYVHLGEARRVRGDHAGALEAMVAGERAAERFGLRGTFGPFMHVNAAEDLVRLGRWDEAQRRLADAERLELSRTTAAMRRATAGLLHALHGDVAAARRELDPPADAELPSEFLAPLAAARATLALAEDDVAAARAHLDGALAAAVQDPFYTPPLYSLALRAEAEAADAARARREPVDPRRADALLAGLDALLTGWAPPDARAHRTLAAAEHARVTGQPGTERWREAAAAWDALAEPYPAAYARLRLAEAELRDGDRAAAEAAAAIAFAAADALRARPLREALAALARRARLDLSPAARDEAPETPGGLTSREADVLRALADGLTNREIADRLFISQKTVSAHLAHIFSKLDVHTRVEAAGRARTLGVLQE